MSIIFKFIICLFLAVSGLLAARAFLELQRAGPLCRDSVWPLTAVASLRETGSGASGVHGRGSRGAERRLSSCGPRAQLLQGKWDLPGLGIKVMPPALAGGFLTTGPPGKSLIPSF